MMKYIFIYLTLSFCIFFSSCDSEKKRQLAFYDTEENAMDSVIYDNANFDTSTEVPHESSNDIKVPFEERNGVKLIDVTVNGQFTVKMILDSGCSGTLISIAEAKYLYEKGCFTKDDIIGVAQSQIADGSIVENMVINLKELVIGGKIACTNVVATVSGNTQAPLLLGNEVLNRVPSYSVDNENKIIIFRLQ